MNIFKKILPALALPLLSGFALAGSPVIQGELGTAPPAGKQKTARLPLEKRRGTASLAKESGNRNSAKHLPGKRGVVTRANASTPDALAYMDLYFPEGSLTGTWSLMMPYGLRDGSDGEGDITCTLQIDGETYKTITTQYGAYEEVEVTVTNGLHDFNAYASNDAGDGPGYSYELFVGKDIPGPPEEIYMDFFEDTKTVSLSWWDVYQGINGGTFEWGDVSYTVTRVSPDRKVIVQNTMDTYAEDVLEEIPELRTSYVYEVTATVADYTSEPRRSPELILGTVCVPPIEFGLADSMALDEFTVENTNQDEREWEFYDGRIRCGYNSDMAMDDWLISPPINVEKGKAYPVRVLAWCENSQYPERLELKWGLSPTSTAMTGVIAEPTEIAVDDAKLAVSGMLVPAESGQVYVGIHGISDADQYILYVSDLSIGTGVSTAVPAAGTLSGTPDPDGSFKVKLTATAPTMNVDDEAVDALERFELTCDGTLIQTWDNVNPGQEFQFEYTPSTGGDHLYAAAAYNSAGKGVEAEFTLFSGINLPGLVQNIDMVENPDKPGEVTITWDAVTEDCNGYPINPAKVVYNIYKFGGGDWILKGSVATTSYTLQAVPEEGPQKFMDYAVFAQTTAGEGEGDWTPYLPLGPAYVDFEESFPDGNVLHEFAMTVAGADWVPMVDGGGVEAADGDNGFLAARGQWTGHDGLIWTGKIFVVDKGIPALDFFLRPLGADDENEMDVYINELGGDRVQIGHYPMSSLTPDVWNAISIPVPQYAGKTVQVTFGARVRNKIYVLLDGISLTSKLANDARIHIPAADAFVRAGEDYEISVRVSNEGRNELQGVKVQLTCDGQPAGETELETLPSKTFATATFPRTMHPLAELPHTYKCTVIHTDDEYEGNNATAEFTVTPIHTLLPVPDGLNTEVLDDGQLVLKWNQPDLSGLAPEKISEGFETGTPFTHQFADWTFIDGDQAVVGGFHDHDIPGFTQGQKASFFIFDGSDPAFEGNTTFKANSGNNFLAALYRADDLVTDDWAISPRLSGAAQKISFYAKSYEAYYPEKFEVLYSETGKTVADFTKIGSVDKVDGLWTRYDWYLPEGARYFAVHSCAKASFMLMLDDFTFEREGTDSHELLGYNVYRDGELLTEQPVENEAYADTEREIGSTAVYRVNAQYFRGLSKPSEPLESFYAGSGLGSIDALAVSVTAGHGTVTVDTGNLPLDVALILPDGTIAASTKLSGAATFQVPAGPLFVRAGKTLRKIIVR